MLDDFPLSVRIDVDRAKDVAKLLLSLDEVSGVDVDGDSLTVRATSPKTFFRDFGTLAVRESLNVRRLEPLDDSAHAILGYLLGGSGKT